MTGCNDVDNSPTMPNNARIIDLSNAKTTFDEAISTTDTILAKDTQATLTINDILDQIYTLRKNSGQDPAARASFDQSLYCLVGSATEVGEEVIDKLGNVTGSGTVTFDSCEIESNVVLNGTVFFDYSWRASGEQINNLSGNIAITRLETKVTVHLNEIAISEETNIKNGSYIINPYQYAYDSGSDGFIVQTGREIRGFDFACGPVAGTIIINGGGGTQLKATYLGNSSLILEVNIDNGIFTEVSGSPFFCGW